MRTSTPSPRSKSSAFPTRGPSVCWQTLSFPKTRAPSPPRRGGELAGYAILSVLFEDAELADIAVSPKFRRRGLADEMLARLEGEALAAGAERVLLEVRVSNAPAMRLYLKRGYVGCGVRPRYYADGEDALIMQKRLAEQTV